MRRTLCFLLILSYWLGPLAELFPANTESRLPACCRRHGAHHCAISGAMAPQKASSSQPSVAAPSRCSSYPGSIAAATEPIQALAASPAGLPALLAKPHSPAACRAAAYLTQISTRTGRGPPAFDIA
jgi:hypothetical protein